MAEHSRFTSFGKYSPTCGACYLLRQIKSYGCLKNACRALVLGFVMYAFMTFVLLGLPVDEINDFQNESFTSNHLLDNEQNAKGTAQGVKKMLLYAYMRSGSSVLGEVFHRNKDVLYWYEPLDGFYQSSFVLRPMTNPLNILYYSNFTKRVVTEDETEAIADFHYRLFHCNYNHVSLAGLLTDNHNSKSSINFKYCGMTDDMLIPCQGLLKEQCMASSSFQHQIGPKKINVEHSMRGECFKQLLELQKNKTDITTGETNPFFGYLQCQQKIMDVFNTNCKASRPMTKCRNKRMQVLKEIRMTMEMVERTMIRIPDLHLVYFHRDPRAVVSSRMSGPPIHELYTSLTFEPKHEARLLCERMASDLKVVSLLKKKYPSRVLQLSFEDFAFEPIVQAQNVYSFLGKTLPDYVADWLKTATNSSKGSKNRYARKRANSSKVVDSWREKLEPELIADFTKSCEGVLLNLNYEL